MQTKWKRWITEDEAQHNPEGRLRSLSQAQWQRGESVTALSEEITVEVRMRCSVFTKETGGCYAAVMLRKSIHCSLFPCRFILTESCQTLYWKKPSLKDLSRRRRPPLWTTRKGGLFSPRKKYPTMILILTKGYVYGTPEILYWSKHHICLRQMFAGSLERTVRLCLSGFPLSCLTVSPSVKQKRKGLRGSVDLEKIKCVETVQPEPNAPQERMYAFQVD